MQMTDVDALFDWENNPNNWDVSDTKEPFTKEEIGSFVNSPQDLFVNGQLRLMICLNNTNLPIGCIDLFEFDLSLSRAGVGILMGEETYKEKGYAKESLTVLIKYASEKLALKQLFCNITPSNKRSILLFEKSGFQFIEERELFTQKVNHYQLLL